MPDIDQPDVRDPQVVDRESHPDPDVTDIEDLVGDEIDPPVELVADMYVIDADDTKSEDGR